MPKISVVESFTVALISGTEKVWSRGGGVSRYYVENFFSHSAENLRRESFTVALISGTEKVLRRGGSIKILRQNFFFLTVSKNSVRESLSVALISGTEKVYGQEGGREYQYFPSKILCLTEPKTSVGNPLLLHLFRVSKKFGEEGGGGVSRLSVKKNFVSRCRKFRRGILYCCINFGY